MRGNFLCLFVVLNSSLLFSCQPPEQTHNVNLDPSRLILDKQGNALSYKKVDNRNQYNRNHKKQHRRYDKFWSRYLAGLRNDGQHYYKKGDLSTERFIAQEVAAMELLDSCYEGGYFIEPTT